MIDARDDIIDIFEKRIFPYKDNAFKTKGESEEESEENKFKNIANFSNILRMNQWDYFGFCFGKRII